MNSRTKRVKTVKRAKRAKQAVIKLTMENNLNKYSCYLLFKNITADELRERSKKTARIILKRLKFKGLKKNFRNLN